MPTRKLPDPWLAASIAGLLALCALIAVFGRDAGITWDEGFQLQYGQRVLAWFRSGFRDRGALDYLDLYLYGGLFDAPAQLVIELLPLDPFETKHLLTALVALLAIAGSWRLAAAVGGRRAGFFAAASLALTPSFIGHGLFNPKDIPFAAAAVWTTVTAQRLVLGPLPFRLRDLLWAGVALGAALGVRPGGAFLLSYPLAAAIARILVERRRERDRPLLSIAAQNTPRLMLGLAVAWAVMLVAWPWAQLDPLRRPLEAIAAAARFNYLGDLLFQGRRVSSIDVPPDYLLVWFGITLPEFYLLALPAGALALALRSRAAPLDVRVALGGGLIAFSIVLPLIAAFVARPVLYDAHRHFLFLFPPLAALAGWGLSAALDAPRLARGVRAGLAAAWIAGALWVAAEIVALHPYQYVYFNRSVGGLPGAVGRFETDYWGASYREGLAWVRDHVRPQRQLRVAACDSNSAGRLFYYLRSWRLQGRFRVEERPPQSDLFLAITRHDCHQRVRGRVLHTVSRQGAPLLYVIHPER